jgi:hypothetical protein
VIYGNKPNSTLRTVKVLPEFNGTKNWYDFDDAEKPENKGAGDDVVPLESALLPGVPSMEARGEDVSVFNNLLFRILVERGGHS